MRECKVKHKDVTLKDIIDEAVFPVVVHNKEEKAMTITHNGGHYMDGPKNMPERMVIMHIVKYTDTIPYKCYYVYYMANGNATENYFIVSENQPFSVLTGTTKDKIIKEIKEFQWKDIKNHLNYSGQIGSDPEIFVTNKDKQIIPAFDFLGSKAEKKHRSRNGGHVYWDGFQAEMDTVANACLAVHSSSVRDGLANLLNLARKHDQTAELSNKTVALIDSEVMNKAKLEHVSLGCMPSFNIYGMSGDGVEDPRQMPVRSAGGHIHFGIGKQTENSVRNMVKALDAIVGVACVSLFQNFDNPVRRKYYGLAGEYRLPPHGLEYRVLSNAWLVHPLIMNLVFDLARKALKLGEMGFLDKWNATESEVIECINTCDVKKAQEILTRNKELFMTLFESRYKMYGVIPKETYKGIFNIFIKGMESVIPNVDDIEGNWNLKEVETTGLYARGKRNFHQCQNDIKLGTKVA